MASALDFPPLPPRRRPRQRLRRSSHLHPTFSHHDTQQQQQQRNKYRSTHSGAHSGEVKRSRRKGGQGSASEHPLFRGVYGRGDGRSVEGWGLGKGGEDQCAVSAEEIAVFFLSLQGGAEDGRADGTDENQYKYLKEFTASFLHGQPPAGLAGLAAFMGGGRPQVRGPPGLRQCSGAGAGRQDAVRLLRGDVATAVLKLLAATQQAKGEAG